MSTRAATAEEPTTARSDPYRPIADARALRALYAVQLAPIVALHERIARRLAEPLNVAGARERIAAGHIAFDPRVVLACAGNLVPAFVDATFALEDAGLISGAVATAVRARAASVYLLLGSWASGELRSYDDVTAVSRYAASLVGRAVLRHASEVARRGEAVVRGWPHPHCPCCGGAPDLALTSDGEEWRTLACVRCDTMWLTDRPGCLGCGEEEPPSVVRISVVSQLGYQLIICNPCARYIKQGPLVPTESLLVERTILTAVDAAAKRRGLRF
ncbi:MAG TPA: formate dehydrogenase accessory protein FdhE [Gemmatimonadaceae bacterium]|nr:formate dehydrogenase accessory protein FdhE [Gemmatimonadaceae bacterium]